jgi:predicted permease
MLRLIFSLGIITVGILFGYILQRLDRNGLMKLPLPIDALRTLLQKIALLFLGPIAIAGAMWMIQFTSVKLAVLPFLGALALIAGGIFALLASRILKTIPRKTGSLFCCGSFTNLGSIGALICFVFLGEHGFALVPIYKLFEEIIYYAIGFPIARSFSGIATESGGFKRIFSLVRDPFIICSLSGIATGILLNTSGVKRPEVFTVINSILVPLTTFILLVSIGLSLRISRVKNYVRESISVAVIKFLLVPILVTTVAYIFGLQNIDGGLPLKVVIILSSMPVAFNSLIPPSIYNLDLDLANSCWIITTAMLVVVLPVLLRIVSSF